jgi:hypothetical protein
MNFARGLRRRPLSSAKLSTLRNPTPTEAQ